MVAYKKFLDPCLLLLKTFAHDFSLCPCSLSKACLLQRPLVSTSCLSLKYSHIQKPLDEVVPHRLHFLLPRLLSGPQSHPACSKVIDLLFHLCWCPSFAYNEIFG